MGKLWAAINQFLSDFADAIDEETHYISWYKDPRSGRLSYLAYSEDSGFYYVPKREDAHWFDTEAEAKDRTPVYDGSSGIEERTGVEII